MIVSEFSRPPRVLGNRIKEKVGCLDVSQISAEHFIFLHFSQEEVAKGKFIGNIIPFSCEIDDFHFLEKVS